MLTAPFLAQAVLMNPHAGECLTWDSALDTGIPEIDREHQQLVALVNQAAWAAQTHQEWLMEAVLDGLLAYAQVHFRHEEHLLELAGYPDLPAHRKEHEAFRGEIAELYADFLRGRTLPDELIPDLLKRWLKEHILGTDHRYIPHMLAYVEGKDGKY